MSRFTVHIAEQAPFAATYMDCIGALVSDHETETEAQAAADAAAPAFEHGVVIWDYESQLLQIDDRKVSIYDHLVKHSNATESSKPDTGASSELPAYCYCYCIQDNDSGFIQQLAYAQSSEHALSVFREQLGDDIDAIGDLTVRHISDAAYTSAVNCDGTDGLAMQYLTHADAETTPAAYTIGMGLYMRVQDALPHPDNSAGLMLDILDVLNADFRSPLTSEADSIPFLLYSNGDAEAVQHANHQLGQVVSALSEAIADNDQTCGSDLLVKGLLDFSGHIVEYAESQLEGSGKHALAALYHLADPSGQHTRLIPDLPKPSENIDVANATSWMFEPLESIGSNGMAVRTTPEAGM